jgi:hypothetical protein
MSRKNPNEILAEQISEKLLEKGLIDKSSEKIFMKGLSQGNYKESDWKTLLEEVIKKPKANSNETENPKH